MKRVKASASGWLSAGLCRRSKPTVDQRFPPIPEPHSEPAPWVG
jgi:hypothetical protein